MTTVQAVLDQSYRYLQSGQNEEMNRLAVDIPSGTTTVTFTYPLKAIKAGAVISIDLEHFYVWEVDDTAKTATVEGGWQGSTPAAHTAATPVWVNPRFSYFAMLSELNSELASYSAPSNGLYKVASVDLTASQSSLGYDLGVSDFIEELDVRIEDDGATNDWPRLTAYEVVKAAEPTVFASGVALILRDWVTAGRKIRVRYKAPFSTLSLLTDTLETTAGLPATAVDIPPLGIAAQLVGMREIKRSFTESAQDTRRADEVPSGSTSAVANRLEAARTVRLREEAGRLARDWPRYRH